MHTLSMQLLCGSCRAQMARPGRGLVHRGAGPDSPGSPRGSPLEALSRRLNAEVEQLRAENARLSVRGPPCSPLLCCTLMHLQANVNYIKSLPKHAVTVTGRLQPAVQCPMHAHAHSSRAQSGLQHLLHCCWRSPSSYIKDRPVPDYALNPFSRCVR